MQFTYDSQGRLVKQSNGLTFFYDHTGIAGFKYNDQYYVYRKDAQGNIIGIVDNTGTVVVEYVYDAWGTITPNGVYDVSGLNLAELNPFRYRGYYCDAETGLYYLKTRYYDPEIDRFMTIDGIEYLDPETINGLNLYAYCNNNPVMNIDPNGTWSWRKFWKTVADFAVTIVATVVAVTVDVVVSSVAGTELGAVAGAATFGGINNFVNMIYYNYISDGKSDLTPSSYQGGYINRWDRLDYTKQQTQQGKYNSIAQMYYSEYSFHMYAWLALGWTNGKNIPYLSKWAGRAADAYIVLGVEDDDPFVKWGSRFFRLLGL